MRAARPDAVLYPTMGSGATIQERYDHHRILADEGLIDMGVIDPGSVNLAGVAPDGPPTGNYVYANSPADITYMMDVCHDTASARASRSTSRASCGWCCCTTSRASRAPVAHQVLLLRRRLLRRRHADVLRAADRRSARPLLRDARRRDLPWGSTVLGGSILDTPIARAHGRARRAPAGRASKTSAAGRPTSSRSSERSRCVQPSVAPVATNAEARAILGMPAGLNRSRSGRGQRSERGRHVHLQTVRDHRQHRVLPHDVHDLDQLRLVEAGGQRAPGRVVDRAVGDGVDRPPARAPRRAATSPARRARRRSDRSRHR